MTMKRLTIGLAGLALLAGLHGPAWADEAPAPKPEVTWAQESSTIVNPSQNTDLDAWESYKGRFTTPSEDQHLTDPILNGAIDLHAHFGPDVYSRQWDAFEIAKLARERGMRGLVFKNHWTESAGTAYLVRKYDDVPGFEAFGGLALNVPEGGINPQAVRYFAEVEGGYARIVWMPTHDSEHEVKYLKENRPYVIVSRDGVLVPQVLEVLDLIKQYNLTLATGHVSPEEMLQIVAEAKKRGIERIVLTHPDMGPMFTDPTIDQLKQAIALGGYVEVAASNLLGRTRAQFVEMIRTLGPDHVFIASDSGLTGSHNHADALVLSIRILREAGFSEAELDKMFRKNPAFLVGLP